MIQEKPMSQKKNDEASCQNVAGKYLGAAAGSGAQCIDVDIDVDADVDLDIDIDIDATRAPGA